MEKIYKLEKDEKNWDVIIKEYTPYHSNHVYCEVCGEKMKFDLQLRDKPYSGWTRNMVYNLVEVCDRKCESFQVMEIYRCRGDEKLYVTNFEDVQERIEYLLGEKTWKTSNK